MAKKSKSSKKKHSTHNKKQAAPLMNTEATKVEDAATPLDNVAENMSTKTPQINKNERSTLYIIGSIIGIAVIIFAVAKLMDSNQPGSISTDTSGSSALEVKAGSNNSASQSSDVTLQQQGSNLQPAQGFTPEQFRNYQETGELNQ